MLHGSIKLVIFDWSGTLSDDRAPVYEANMRLFDEFGLRRIPLEMWLPTITKTVGEYFKPRGIHVTADDVHQKYEDYYRTVNQEGIRPALYPHVKDVLTDLHDRGVAIAVISSHPSESLTKEIGSYDISRLIDYVKGNLRDKTDAIKETCLHYGVDAAQAIYIGDTTYDIKAAKTAGVQSGAIDHGYHMKDVLEKELPDYLFSSLEKLSALPFSVEGNVLRAKEALSH